MEYYINIVQGFHIGYTFDEKHKFITARAGAT